MKKIFFFVITMALLLCSYSCNGNDVARKEYETEMAKLKEMEQEHKREISVLRASGASEAEILLVNLQNKQEEMEQADKVYELAKKAGLEE